MRIEDLLASPMVPSFTIEVSPGQFLEVDMAGFEDKKEEFKAFCLSIPNIDGASWKLIKSHTNNNGLMAKLLIALGERAGIWKVHPPVSMADLWQKSPFYPMILSGSIEGVPSSKVPKPSRGDLERDTKLCVSCNREMGPQDSLVHDLREARDSMCFECDDAGCEPGKPCKLDADVEKYLRSFEKGGKK